LRRHLKTSIAVAAVLVAIVAVEVRLFVVPHSDRPGPSDAVVVLGGETYQARLEAADALLQQYPGSVLVASISGGHTCPDRPPTASAVICFRPNPLTTQGEARETAKLAAQHGWKSVTVVTTAEQVWRARLRFTRCWSGQLHVLQAPTGIEVRLRLTPYESAASIKAEVFQRGC
jgi:uncharacterized SAM-binding protein YcdF (DUF218 family)